MTPARRAALTALRATLDRGHDLQAALEAQRLHLSPRDARLATELTYGTVRLRGRINVLLSLILPRFYALSHLTQRLLELAAYERHFLRVPPHATYAWLHDAAKRLLGPRLAALTHAALHRLEALAPCLHDEAAFAAAGGTPAQWFSLPPWIWNLWVEEVGLEGARQMAAMSLDPAPVGVRVRPSPRAADVRQELAPIACATGRYGFALPGWEKRFAVAENQGDLCRLSLASQEAVAALDPASWPEPVWDACAGHGGKATLLADLGKAVWASDLHAGRMAGLRAQAHRLGLFLPMFRADARRPPLQRRPGSILLDVPCTGLGVLAHRPDIRWKRSPQDMVALAQTQRALLDAAASLVPAKGVIAYLTCTLTRMENEGQIEAFLQRHPQFYPRTQGTTPRELGEVFFFALLERKA